MLQCRASRQRTSWPGRSRPQLTIRFHFPPRLPPASLAARIEPPLRRSRMTVALGHDTVGVLALPPDVTVIGSWQRALWGTVNRRASRSCGRRSGRSGGSAAPPHLPHSARLVAIDDYRIARFTLSGCRSPAEAAASGLRAMLAVQAQTQRPTLVRSSRRPVQSAAGPAARDAGGWRQRRHCRRHTRHRPTPALGGLGSQQLEGPLLGLMELFGYTGDDPAHWNFSPE